MRTSGLNLVKYFPDSDDQGGNTFLTNACLNIYLEKGDDERSQGEVGSFLELGVKFFNG